MLALQNRGTFASHIPRLDQDPVERRRLLNIQAQRRYRIRKRERLQAQNHQTHVDPAAITEIIENSNEAHDDASGHVNPEIHSIFEPSSPVSLRVESSTQNDDLNYPLPVYDDNPPNNDNEILAITNTDISSDSSTDDALLSLLAPTEMIQDQTEFANHDPTFSAFWTNENALQSATLPASSELISSREVESQSYSQIQANATSPFADYAISTPGLSVICAKVNIFNDIVGPGFSLDIWEPAAVSPISLGVLTRPCPINFEPTMLQRSIEHHPLIDCFPWPSFRDRFLYTMSLPKELRPKIAQDDMPMVTLEIMMAAKDAGGGLRIWGSNANLAENWEVGQTFYSKFWWALDATIVRMSNRHRERRGERRLRFDPNI